MSQALACVSACLFSSHGPRRKHAKGLGSSVRGVMWIAMTLWSPCSGVVSWNPAQKDLAATDSLGHGCYMVEHLNCAKGVQCTLSSVITSFVLGKLIWLDSLDLKGCLSITFAACLLCFI